MNQRLIAGLAVGVLVAACAAPVLAAAPTPEKAPEFSLEDPDGNAKSIREFRGAPDTKAIVLYWVNWDCPFDKRHHKAGTWKALHEKYHKQGVVILGINSTKYQDKARNKKEIAGYGLPYTVLDDHPGDVGHAYKAKTTPDVRIIDKAGHIVYRGGVDNDPRGRKTSGVVHYVEKALDELLAGKPVSTPTAPEYGCSVKYAK